MEPKLNCRKDTELKELNQAGPRLRPAIATILFFFIEALLMQKETEQNVLKETTCVRKCNIILLGT